MNSNLDNFSFMWDNWFIPLINDVYDEINEDFKQECNVRIKQLDPIKENIKRYYRQRRDELKQEYYGILIDHDIGNFDKKFLDFHKLAAVLCRSFLEYKVYFFDVDKAEKFIDKMDKKDTDYLINTILVNFKLAFYVSIVFLYQSMLFKAHRDNKQDIYKELLKNSCLDLYENDERYKNKQHESFKNCIILDLAKRDINDRSFDFFLYATIMYQLEQYNIMLLEKSNKVFLSSEDTSNNSSKLSSFI